LIPSWLVATRDAGSEYEFMQDVASRMRSRVTDSRRNRIAFTRRRRSSTSDKSFVTISAISGVSDGACALFTAFL
jgi:hypothetical protein